MKHIITAACTLLVASTVAFAQPKIEIVGGDTHDWGKVAPPASGQLEATIKIKNVGTGILNLTEVKPGCGCTKTDPDKTSLAQGEVSTMGVKLNISPSQNGSITKTITVRSNSAGADSVKTLWLKADIFRQVAFEPANYFSLAQAFTGKETSASVTVVNNSEKTLVLSDFVVPDNMKLNIGSKVEIPAKSKQELTLSTTPKGAGAINGTVKFKTSNPENPTAELQVWGTVVPAQTEAPTSSPK